MQSEGRMLPQKRHQKQFVQFIIPVSHQEVIMSYFLKKSSRQKTSFEETKTRNLMKTSLTILPTFNQPPTSTLSRSRVSKRYLQEQRINTLINFQTKHKKNQLMETLSKRLSSSKMKNSANKQKLDKNQFSSLMVTTKSWCLLDSKAKKYVGFRVDYKREIASLTKIMTTLLSIETIRKLFIPTNTLIRVTQTASSLVGTSAELKPMLWVTLEDLLYGTMLPSGNDAAYCLAQYIGFCLLASHNKGSQYFSMLQKLDLTKQSTSLYVQQFIRCMNDKAAKMQLLNTKFSNPHGLQNAFNNSSAKDILRLSLHSYKNKMFRKVCNTQYHKYQMFDGETTERKVLKTWWNTNKLLGKGWEGIKTGQTSSAGSCLSSLREGIYIVVLNSTDSQARFTDTQKIYDWYIKNYSKSTNQDEKRKEQIKLPKSQSLLTQDSIDQINA